MPAVPALPPSPVAIIRPVATITPPPAPAGARLPEAMQAYLGGSGMTERATTPTQRRQRAALQQFTNLCLQNGGHWSRSGNTVKVKALNRTDAGAMQGWLRGRGFSPVSTGAKTFRFTIVAGGWPPGVPSSGG